MALNVFKQRIRRLLLNYHRQLNRSTLSNERHFIKRTTSFFRSRSVSHGGHSLTTQSAYIDRSPIVEFYHNTPWPNPDRREIGDILYVSKFKRNKRVIKKRAVIIQSKFTKTNQRTWKKIDTAQFYLAFKWPHFTRVRPKPKTAYTLSPNCLTWGSYAFVGPNALNYPLYFTSTRIFRRHPSILSLKTFTFNIKRPLGWDTSPSFLMKQIFCLIGVDLLSNNSIGSFVDELCRMVNLEQDPPGEFEWQPNQQEEPKGFGVIEFTLSSEE